MCRREKIIVAFVSDDASSMPDVMSLVPDGTGFVLDNTTAQSAATRKYMLVPDDRYVVADDKVDAAGDYFPILMFYLFSG